MSHPSRIPIEPIGEAMTAGDIQTRIQVWRDFAERTREGGFPAAFHQVSLRAGANRIDPEKNDDLIGLLWVAASREFEVRDREAALVYLLHVAAQNPPTPEWFARLTTALDQSVEKWRLGSGFARWDSLARSIYHGRIRPQVAAQPGEALVRYPDFFRIHPGLADELRCDIASAAEWGQRPATPVASPTAEDSSTWQG